MSVTLLTMCFKKAPTCDLANQKATVPVRSCEMPNNSSGRDS